MTALAIGNAFEDWSGDATYVEYSRGANPVGAGLTPKVPMERFSARLHTEGATGIVPLDLSTLLAIDSGPATSPALAASFVHIEPTRHVATDPVCTSELY